MYGARKNFEFCNMLLVAKYTLRKNLEKAHIRQIWTTKGSNFVQKRPIWGNPGLFIVADYFLRKSISRLSRPIMLLSARHANVMFVRMNWVSVRTIWGACHLPDLLTLTPFILTELLTPSMTLAGLADISINWPAKHGAVCLLDITVNSWRPTLAETHRNFVELTSLQNSVILKNLSGGAFPVWPSV